MQWWHVAVAANGVLLPAHLGIGAGTIALAPRDGGGTLVTLTLPAAAAGGAA
jgi:hypothetical protein